jgi:primosomal protein N'
MRIQTVKQQHRRGFTAVFECEHCGNTESGNGYDDENFHCNVIPKMKCSECGEVAPENYRPLGTKYPWDEVV